jgi:hypothetical protein
LVGAGAGDDDLDATCDGLLGDDSFVWAGSGTIRADDGRLELCDVGRVDAVGDIADLRCWATFAKYVFVEQGDVNRQAIRS